MTVTAEETQQSHARGEAQKRDAALLALLALLTLSETHRIAPTWNRLAPRAYRGLASATPAAPLIAPAAAFWFDPETMQYGRGTSGIIPATAIRHALNVFNANAAAEVGTITRAATMGTMPVAMWQDVMTRAIKDYQLVNAAIGRGGSNLVTDGDLKLISPTVEYQLGRLDRFAGQIAADEVDVDAAAHRAGAYAKTAVTTYDGMRRRAADVAGFTMEINRLGQAEHCMPDERRPWIPDCPGLTGMGWVPLGALPPIGMRLCIWNCRCHIDFAK